MTRVNRPYGDFRVGYVVDFADISNEFDITNKAYFDELNREYDTDSTGENGFDVFGSLFMSKEEIDEKIENMKNILSDYDTENLENFQNEITALSLADINKLKEMKKVLEDIKEIYNVAKLLGHTEALEKIDPKNISRLYREAENRLNLINLQNSI
ncbi:MAG: hypothetical protein LBD88_04470 [Candidatus Peribacteria bacterium]|nr:hypothetical protein [Candidatus Peribacteria bacterium]